MERRYLGNYFQIDEDGTESSYGFKIEIELDDNLSFTGTVWEDEFSEISGKLVSVRGFIDGDHISFVKKYPCKYEFDENLEVVLDIDKPGHEVIYDGYWNEELENWTGEWYIQDDYELFLVNQIKTFAYFGSFEMKEIQ
jgi:hypothetical protein